MSLLQKPASWIAISLAGAGTLAYVALLTFVPDTDPLIGLLAGVLTAATAALLPQGIKWARDMWSEPKLEIFYEPEEDPENYVQCFDLQESSPVIDMFRQGVAPFLHKGKRCNVMICNKGRMPTEACDASLEVIGRPSGCAALSGTAKRLEIPEQIRPGPPYVPLYVVFATSRDRRLVAARCTRSKSGECLLVAWIAVQGQPQPYDGMCLGEFDVRIRVRPGNGKGVQRDFRIFVSDSWQELGMKPLGESVRIRGWL